MKLHDYFQQGNVRKSDLARAIGAHPVTMSQWAAESRRVPAEHCPAIERATGGAVRCEDLRPDVDWTFLRNTTPEPPPAPSRPHPLPASGQGVNTASPTAAAGQSVVPEQGGGVINNHEAA